MESRNNGLMLLMSKELMISMVDEHRDAIRRAFDALPDGTRAEIVDGEIIVSPFPNNPHQRIVMYLNGLLARAIPDDWWVDTSGGVILEPDWNEFRPDLQIAPSAAWPSDSKGPIVAEVKLMVEVTSPGKRNLIRDRETKYAAYARAGIPLYLIVDRYDAGGYTTLYWNPNPEKDEYQDRHSVPFGEKLTLPKPFEVEIDTVRF